MVIYLDDQLNEMNEKKILSLIQILLKKKNIKEKKKKNRKRNGSF